MAGGTFDKSVGKVRPGTYINFEASNQRLRIYRRHSSYGSGYCRRSKRGRYFF